MTGVNELGARAIQATPRRSSVFRIVCGEFRVQDVKFGIGVLVISSCIFVATLQNCKSKNYSYISPSSRGLREHN